MRPAAPAGALAPNQRPEAVASEFAGVLDSAPEQARADIPPAPAPPPLAPAPVLAESGVLPEMTFDATGDSDPIREDDDPPSASYFNGSAAMLTLLAQLLSPKIAAPRPAADAPPQPEEQARPAAAPLWPGPPALPDRADVAPQAVVLRQPALGLPFTPPERVSAPVILASKVETHLEPAGVQPVYLQVAQRIDSALSPVQYEAGPQPATAPQILPESAKAPLQVLRLQLQPADLGAVEVRLHLRAGDIHVRIAVESADARLQLETNVDRLGVALREKGYDVQSLVITQDAAPLRQQDQQGRANADSSHREQGDDGQRSAFDQRDRHDRRDHARGRNDRDRHDRDGQDRDRFAG